MYRLLPYRRDLAENQCSVDRRGRRVRALVFLGIRPASAVDGLLVVGDGEHAVADRHALIQADAGQSVCHGIAEDRKSTRLNSSHVSISYAVFCLKKKKIKKNKRKYIKHR